LAVENKKAACYNNIAEIMIMPPSSNE